MTDRISKPNAANPHRCDQPQILKEHLPAYLDMSISPTNEGILREHLKNCQTCDEALEVFEGTLALANAELESRPKASE